MKTNVTSSETFIKAAIKSLKARLSKRFTTSISETVIFMKDAPELLQKEWENLKKEIILEVERLEKTDNERQSYKDFSVEKEEYNADKNRVDRIRKKISELTNQIEGIN